MFEPGEFGYIVNEIPPEEITVECQFSNPCLYWRSCSHNGCGVKDYKPTAVKGEQVRILSCYDEGMFTVESVKTMLIFEVNSRQIMRTPPMFNQHYT